MKYVIDYARRVVVAIGDAKGDRLEAQLFMIDHLFWRVEKGKIVEEFRLDWHAPNVHRVEPEVMPAKMPPPTDERLPQA